VQRYRNRSGAVPPACVPGSAHGIRSVVVNHPPGSNDTRVRFKARGISVPAIAGTVRLSVDRGGAAANECALFAEHGYCSLNASGTRAKCN